ncbi:RNA-binding protein 33 isoform X3 [Myxocyprinus asiaticus]|uniref:RNA-binding protein 33 isoform X3 n=1 Tax=Myxocyprinus asiaticus TaxID=70543 RepID=UPI00222341EA|nr:RNA-binding protein 33 isoform X3 [Myxocyprinus asiaticus]
MATNAGDDEFDEYDKPGAERSRRRRGDDDDDLESDLEEDLLEEDWLSSKKNPSELSDEELNDDLLQSDEEDQIESGQGEVLSLNATLGLGTSGQLQDEDAEGGRYTEEAFEQTEVGQEGFAHDEEYGGEEYQGEEEGMEYTGEQNYDGYQDEVLDLQIDEPLDDDFQVDDYPAEYSEEQQEQQTDQQEVDEEEHEEETEYGSQVPELEEAENDPVAEAEPDQGVDVKEESDEEEEDDEESGRLRFKTERKDATVVRLSDATTKRRNIPETLELSEEAKADLQEFEEKERQRKQGRFGGQGRGGLRADGGRGGMAGRGGVRGRGGQGGGGRCEFPPFGMGNFRGDGVGGRGRINEQRPPLMQMNLGMQQLRMTPPLQHHQQSRLTGHRGAGGPGLFPEPGASLPQQPLQLLMPHLAHRSPGPSPRAQHDTHGLRILSSLPRHAPPHPNQQQQHQQHHSKNIHINPHFRGPSSSPVQVPSMPPVQNQPRTNIAPQRLPAPPDFQRHLQGNFGPPQRPLPPQEQWRGPLPSHQDREHFYTGEPHFPGQHQFDQTGPPPLMNSNVLPMSGQGPLPFPPQGGLGGSVFGPLGLGQSQGPQGGGVFQRESPRQSLAPQHAGPPGPRGFVGHRQPFSPQQLGPPFSPQNMPFGMQGLMQQHSQPLHHDPSLSHQHLHQQQHQQHRQDLPPQGLPHSQPLPQHHQHYQHHPRDQHPTVHVSQPNFCQPVQSGHRPMQPRPQGIQQRNNPPRPRMTSPSPLQKIPPQRNSNLRELPIATGNNNVNLSVPSGQAKPVTRATQNVRSGQPARAGPAGRGGPVAQRQVAAKVLQQPSAPQMKKERPAAQSSTTPEDPDEDEETRQYRLKIEEQKRLREEILKHKELRRQQQAGVRKKELMERISGRSQNQTSQTQNPTQPPTAQRPSQPPQQVSLLSSNGTTQNPSSGLSTPRENVKARLQNTKPQTPTSGWSGAQQQQKTGPPVSQQGQWQPQQKKTVNPQNTQGQGTVQSNPAGGQILGQPQPGGKRTVMQRTNSVESSQVPQKVRVVKLLGEADAGPNPVAPPQQQHQQPIGRPAPQQRLSPNRKVTVATGTVQNQQAGRGMANQTNRVVVRGRGRGRGVGRAMMQQNPRAQDGQRSTVCIEGLSTTTTNKQLMNLLNSIGPIERFTMFPEQQKAIAKFVNPQHAVSFQHSFHRHMIDLSHIDVSIIDG